ncbi:MAG: hypothetical protein FGM27_01590 [Candidatus Omnitrophica bacterium]|nr:hypothetical protein [Candidatus Omnitrophota bacterium]
MARSVMMSFMGLVLVMMTLTGCASKKGTTKQINALQAQVGVLTDEVIRLDDALQSTRTALQEEENRRSELNSQLSQSSARIGSLREEESVIRGIYRTPSGFELPSASIQKALKNAGYYQGAVDGKIGPGTRKAIEAFQRDNGLSADGVVGRKTWSKLKSFTAGA